VSLGEGSAGAGLEIPLEGDGLAVVVEPDRYDALPRDELARVRRLARIVLLQASWQVLGGTDVVFLRTGQAAEQIDVSHMSPFPDLLIAI
jgi:hypothetical protein